MYSQTCQLVREVRVVGWDISYGAEFVPSAKGGYTWIVQKSTAYFFQGDRPIAQETNSLAGNFRLLLMDSNIHHMWSFCDPEQEAKLDKDVPEKNEKGKRRSDHFQNYIQEFIHSHIPTTGLTLSTKINSTFFLDAGFNEVTEVRKWVEAHKEELNDIALEKPNQIVTPTKLSPTPHKKFTEIQHLKGRLLGRKYYWVRATPSIKTTKQAFWYISCNNCNKVTHDDFNEMFLCVYCKHPTAKAVPRANATVQLEDESGTLDASAIADPA
ncbi:unnamed protein product [Fraxinus pennsylvanica]|uniref:Patellin-1-6 C-terminal GOLD domain-containing protein n=1 Tax=Fraxinus pennsylvanica TaxID=56036 RepID=A0AAD1ZRW9_9LAMI|nr:unnamed protein product [Fraxinus pennsylvanica]